MRRFLFLAILVMIVLNCGPVQKPRSSDADRFINSAERDISEKEYESASNNLNKALNSSPNKEQRSEIEKLLLIIHEKVEEIEKKEKAIVEKAKQERLERLRIEEEEEKKKAALEEEKRRKEKGFAELVQYRVEYLGEDYSREDKPWGAHLRLYLKFRNNSDSTITGLKYDLKFLDGFGDVLYQSNFKDQIRIEGRQTSKMDKYWYWEDNPFIGGEPFDKMWSAVSSKTIKLKIKFVQAALDDGTQVSLKKKWMDAPIE